MISLPFESVTVVDKVPVVWEVKPLQDVHEVENDVEKMVLSRALAATSSGMSRHRWSSIGAGRDTRRRGGRGGRRQERF
jgi:hypothetical protein